MSTLPTPEPQPEQVSREGTWAKPVDRLQAASIQADMNLNVDGKQVAGPLRGFGQMWQKTYKIRLAGVKTTPQAVIQNWKENFGSFWPKINRFYGTAKGIQAGEVAVLNLAGPYGITAPGGKGLISTGVLVIYSDDESFSFMTPDGHIFGGMITFSAYDEGGETWAQVQALIRANDPLYELGARMGVVHKTEDDHWHAVLTNLAKHFGVAESVKQDNILVDPRMMWSQFWNIRHNAAIYTGIYLALTPFRWAAGLFRKKPAV
jgi:hypothetical protein